MYDLSKLAELSNVETYSYWFRRLNSNRFKILDTQSMEEIGYLFESETTSVCLNDESNYKNCCNDIISCFPRFKARPEYLVGKSVDFQHLNCDISEYYDTLLLGVGLIRCEDARKSCIRYSENILNPIKWLHNTDFYTAPASTIYHESYPGGLLVHTLNVYNNIVDLINLKKFKDVDICSACLVALVHDWCKIGLYESYNRNVKDEYGNWTQVVAYKRTNPAFPLGHGTSSAYLASTFYKLTMEEYSSIRWHMSVWYCHESEHNDLQEANEKFPLVHMLQFADQLSIVGY